MRKLKLDLEKLAVESFEMGVEEVERGTVHARDTLPDTGCNPWCTRYDSCGSTCRTCLEPSCLDSVCGSCLDSCIC